MLALLREQFVNCWVLAKDLEAIAARDGSPEMKTLCMRLRENYGYPVDSVLVAPDLRVIGHVNAHDVHGDAVGYVKFLRDGLAAVGRTPVVADTAPKKAEVAQRVRQVEVTPEKPSTSLLDVISCRGFGEPSFAYYSIDTRAFDGGGVLEIEVRVGRAAPAVTFEVCAPVAAGDGHAVQPVQTESVASEGTAKLVHTFKKGDMLGLMVKPGPGSSEGDANAFLATVTVRRP
ncbi:MAG TPA: hypothetical protein VF384_00425 [Planctomycetota bacterium]